MMNEAQILPLTWPNLTNLFQPLDKRIDALSVLPAPEGQKVLIRFINDYGVEIFQYPEADFLEMAVIKFTQAGMGNYEFALNIPIPELTLGYTEEDLFRLCEQVSRLQ